MAHIVGFFIERKTLMAIFDIYDYIIAAFFIYDYIIAAFDIIDKMT